jgi:hypothetical protein
MISKIARLEGSPTAIILAGSAEHWDEYVHPAADAEV